MDRRYIRIQPSGPGCSKPDGQESASPSFEPRRPRAGVSVACDECRRKRVRCNGQRPVCANCSGKRAACRYRDDATLSAESGGLLVEMIEALNQMPTASRDWLLSELKGETDASRIVSALREGAMSPLSNDSPEALNIDPPNSIHVASQAEQFPHHGLSHRNPDPHPSPVELENEPINSTAFTSRVEPQEAVNAAETSATTPIDPVRRPKAHDLRSAFDLCDSRLSSVNIARWTDVNISNLLAARCISLYLVTDHPLLGHFDPELFITDLVSGYAENCSNLLVNALLFWACQMYSAVDDQVDDLAPYFCAQAEMIWQVEQKNSRDSRLNIAAAEFLSLGYLGQGKAHAVLKYLKAAADMGSRMGLFTIGGQGDASACESEPSAGPRSAQLHAAWGAFNWLTLVSFFYRQPGVICPEGSPRYPVPVAHSSNLSQTPLALEIERVSSPTFMGDTFPYSCLFWNIIREVSWVYHAKGQLPWGSRSSLAFAEFKFRELLAWSNGLPSQMTSKPMNPHHVHVLHLWLHAAVLDIFRPFIHNDALSARCLRTFTNYTSTPLTVYNKSTMRLKKLIISYRINYASSSYSVLWHTALIYVANEVLNNTGDEDWYSYLLLCLFGYERLSRSWRVAGAIAKGLLSMALEKGDISSTAANSILKALELGDTGGPLDNVRATFMLDLDRSRSEPTSSTVEYLAERFEDNLLFSDYTNVFERECT